MVSNYVQMVLEESDRIDDNSTNHISSDHENTKIGNRNLTQKENEHQSNFNSAYKV